MKTFACCVGLLGLLGACTQSPAQIIDKAMLINKGVSDNKTSVNPYKVKVVSGDTVYSISKKYGVQIRDLIEINGLQAPFMLLPKQVLRLPQAAYHMVTPGDTVYAIARSYGVDISRLVYVNNIPAPYVISPGSKVLLPSATAYVDLQDTQTVKTAQNKQNRKSKRLREIVSKDLKLLDEDVEQPKYVLPKNVKIDEKAPIPLLKASTYPKPQFKPGTKYSAIKARVSKSDGFVWPVQGRVISHFGPKKGGLYNDGLNIKARKGELIRAAESGKVVYSGNELRGYGNLVLIKHDNGFLTAYAHASSVSVKKGDRVEKGQAIASVGQSGHVSEPQLHFSIRKGRKAINPQRYLPRNVSMN